MTKISRQRISKIRDKGFTLIEIMIVLGILGAIMVVGIPRLVRPNEQNLNSSIRHMMVLSKEVRNRARLSKSTYRIAIRMDEREGHAYWVERASGTLRPTQESEVDRDDEESKSPFQPDTRILKEMKPLPSGFYFGDVETITQQEGPIDQGTAYIHYFHDGMVEEAVIHLTNKKNMNWTLAIHPLTGKMDIVKSNVGLREMRNQ